MRSLRWIGLAAAIIGGAYLFHRPVLRAAAAFMVVDDTLQPAALLLPMGDLEVAASLFAEGYAKEVGIWREPASRVTALGLVPPEHERIRAALEAAGVPRDRIVLLDGTAVDTEALGRTAGAYLSRGEEEKEEGGGRRKIIAVTSGPWSRLTREDLNRGLEGTGIEVMVRSTPDTTFDDAYWWRSERGLITYLDAYALWVRHRVAR